MNFLEGESVKLLQGDCLELMKDIPDGSVDMLCTYHVLSDIIKTYHLIGGIIWSN